MPYLARRSPRDPFELEADRHGAGWLGMVLFLVALAVLFVSTLVGMLVIRIQLAREGLWPADLPSLPVAVWIGTGLIILSSLPMHLATMAAHEGRTRPLFANLAVVTGLGVIFLALQGVAVWRWSAVLVDHWSGAGQSRLALTGFYVLAGLHALHVLGGILVLGVTTWRARKGAYTANDHVGVNYAAAYWHFLGAVWLVMLLFLMMTK